MTESTFYKRHYGGSTLSLAGSSLDSFLKSMLFPGKRYHLLMEDLEAANPRGGTLVELGCGRAELLLILERIYQLDRLVGFDITAGDTGESKSIIEYKNANLNSDWPLEAGSVDYLVAMMVFEHLFDPFHSFKEIRRVLSPGGHAYVNVPLVTSIKHRLKLAAGNLPSTSSPYDNWYEKEEWDGGHLHWFSVRSLHDLSKHCGLQIECIRGVGRFHKIKSLLPGLLASEVTLRLSAS